jgi:hypothetical protein
MTEHVWVAKAPSASITLVAKTDELARKLLTDQLKAKGYTLMRFGWNSVTQTEDPQIATFIHNTDGHVMATVTRLIVSKDEKKDDMADKWKAVATYTDGFTRSWIREKRNRALRAAVDYTCSVHQPDSPVTISLERVLTQPYATTPVCCATCKHNNAETVSPHCALHKHIKVWPTLNDAEPYYYAFGVTYHDFDNLPVYLYQVCEDHEHR